MIDEKFLKSAVQIRRNYLKLINNLDLYKSAASSISNKLEETLKEINSLEADYADNKIDSKQTLESTLKIIDGIEAEGKRLAGLIEPINQEIEKLAIQEQELYRQITTHHYDLSEDEIVSVVRDRLIDEGLS